MLRGDVHAAHAAPQAAAHLREQRPGLAKAPGHEELEAAPVGVVGLGQRLRRGAPRAHLPHERGRLAALQDEVAHGARHVALVQVIRL